MSAMRKTQAEIEGIIATAKAQADPYIRIMNEIAKHSIPMAIMDADGMYRVLYGYESNMVYMTARDCVEDIFEDAQTKLNE